jgi:hypothetical protein
LAAKDLVDKDSAARHSVVAAGCRDSIVADNSADSVADLAVPRLQSADSILSWVSPPTQVLPLPAVTTTACAIRAACADCPGSTRLPRAARTERVGSRRVPKAR